MKHTKKKICKIVDEIIYYLFSMGATDISVNIKEIDDHFIIILTCDYKEGQDEKINKLVKALKCPKEEEIEEYYWELTGSSSEDCELSLVGMMIDQFEVSYSEDRLTVTLNKQK